MPWNVLTITDVMDGEHPKAIRFWRTRTTWSKQRWEFPFGIFWPWKTPSLVSNVHLGQDHGAAFSKEFLHKIVCKEVWWEIDDMFFFFLPPTRPAADNLLSIIWSTLSPSQEDLKPWCLPHNVSGEFQTSLKISPSCLTKDNRVQGSLSFTQLQMHLFLSKVRRLQNLHLKISEHLALFLLCMFRIIIYFNIEGIEKKKQETYWWPIWIFLILSLPRDYQSENDKSLITLEKRQILKICRGL